MPQAQARACSRTSAGASTISLAGVPSIGDSLRDLQAAAAVGAQPILVLTGKGEKTRARGGLPAGTTVYPDLAAAVQSIIK